MAEALTLAGPRRSVQADTALQLERQARHWASAAHRLQLDDLAAPEAWGRLEQYLGVALRSHLLRVVGRVQAEAGALEMQLKAARSGTAWLELEGRLNRFRQLYLRTETTLDYFADALNTRTNPRTGAMLRACDSLAHRSMAQLLDPLGKPTPVALTYLDKGLGASILKAGLRLWDGGETCPVAVIKITRHNLLRPTALIHEAGHQVAHIVGWNDELRAALESALRPAGSEIATIWASWASEIAADAFAFTHTGYASIVALHDVLAGGQAAFRYFPGDPHPIGHLRVMLGVAMCRHVYGDGPWDGLQQAWQHANDPRRAGDEVRQIVADSSALLGRVVEVTLERPMRAFGGRALRDVIAPERVSPAALGELEARVGPALYTSAHWLWSEPLRLLALTGLRAAEQPADLKSTLDRQEQVMLRLGGANQTN